MNRNVLSSIALTVIMAIIAGREVNAQDPSNDTILGKTFGQIATGQVKLLDLTHSLNDRSPFWPGENYESFQLRTIATLEKNGVSSKEFSMPEHFGTHIDAPCHFENGQPSVDEIALGDLVAPGVAIDITMPAETDADYRLTVNDLTNWERTHGAIPARAIVLLNTGWGRFWNSNERYRNQDVQGKMHFPGYSAEAARWLIKERDVRGIGIDTLSIDYGPSKDFIVHHIVNGAGRYGLENVANLNQLPPRDFFLIVAPIKITQGTGGPTRILAAVSPTPKPAEK